MIKFTKETMHYIIVPIFLSIFGSFITVMCFYPRTIEFVDIVGIEEGFIQETVRQSLTEDEKKKKVDYFARALSASVEHYSKKNKVALVPKQVIIAGAKDATKHIMADVKKRMNP